MNAESVEKKRLTQSISSLQEFRDFPWILKGIRVVRKGSWKEREVEKF